MKEDLENGARPVFALGQLACPFGRLGALVFQPDARKRQSGRMPKRSDPDSRLWQDDHKSWRTRGWKNVHQRGTNPFLALATSPLGLWPYDRAVSHVAAASQASLNQP